MRALSELEGRRPAGGHLLPEVMGEHDDTLRMALGRLEQRPQGLADPAAGLHEPVGDVLGDVRVAEPPEPDRDGRAVQRPLPGLEQLLHEAGLGAGEDVRGDLAVVLDVASDQPVEILDLPDVLELVERDVGTIAAASLELRRQIDQRMERGERFGPIVCRRRTWLLRQRRWADGASATLTRPLTCRRVRRRCRFATSPARWGAPWVPRA